MCYVGQIVKTDEQIGVVVRKKPYSFLVLTQKGVRVCILFEEISPSKKDLFDFFINTFEVDSFSKKTIEKLSVEDFKVYIKDYIKEHQILFT